MPEPTVAPQFPRNGRAKIAFVGEAPADEEMRKGEPFVGASGQIFNALLRSASIRREDCLVTNVFNTQLPDNDIAHWCWPTKELNRWRKDEGVEEHYDLPPVVKGKYLAPEHRHHLERLEAEIDCADPNVIVPLGGTALWAFTGASGIQQRRGTVDQALLINPGRKILPTFHPAYLIHWWQAFSTVVKDLIKAEGEQHSPKITTTKRELWIEPTLDDIENFFKSHIAGAEVLSLDIETKPAYRQITAFGVAPSPHIALCIPFVDERNPSRNYWETPEEEFEAVRWVRRICSLGGSAKLGQNFPYDAQWLWTLWRIPVVNYREDTRLLHHALYPELPKDLGFLGSIYARERSWKTLRGKKEEKRDS